MQINELKDELETAVLGQNFAAAQEIQQRITVLETKLGELSSRPTTHDVEVFREERDDPLTLLKCLSIVCELLKNSPVFCCLILNQPSKNVLNGSFSDRCIN